METRLGHYQILNKIGAGGMGEVYRAMDTRLDREVAIKVLPADLANDADRLRRFEQEARATSALNHPNILTIYDIGTHEEVPYLVAELLEGEELRDQLNAGQLPVKKAIDVAQQVAAGLAAAHEKGIVHRDLKPENLFVTKDGRVKILDFGLAKLRQRGGTNSGSEVATQKQMTDPGTVMGTVAYMSPEQAQGREADHRSDIFSFGLILYEMLAGQRAFGGESTIAVLSAILRDDPQELSETNPRISPALDRIVRRCLEKRPEQRFQTASDMGFALESLTTTSGSNRPEAQAIDRSISATPGSWRNHLVWIGLALMTLIALVLGVGLLQRPTPNLEPMRLSITPPEKAGSIDWPTISPDGRTLAFVAEVAGKSVLYVRPLNSTTTTPLAEVEHRSQGAPPFWSPDSKYLAFHTGGKLKKIALEGGTVDSLCDLTVFSGGTWSKDGVILFAENSNVIKRISANGGSANAVLNLDSSQGQLRLRGPVFLPDGHHFVYYSYYTDQAKVGAWLASVDGGETRLLLGSDTVTTAVSINPSTQGSGSLYFVRQGALLAQPFDFRRNQISGDPVRIVPFVARNANGFGRFSVAQNGTVVLMEGARNMQFTWLDRTGKQLETVFQAGRWLDYRLSPDAQRVIAERMEPQSTNADLYLLDLARGSDTRFTFDPLHDQHPIWSPDGNRIVWGSNRAGPPDLYQKIASGAGQDELILSSLSPKQPLDWSADGRFILYQENNTQTNSDLMVLPMEGERKPLAWLNTSFNEGGGRFSPDGKWIAYISNESGRNEVYLQSFVPGAPASGGKLQLSINSGSSPVWRRDGRELFFVSGDRKLMAVDVTLGAVAKAGRPRELFSIRGRTTTSFDVSADGQRFLTVAGDVTGPTSFTIVLNWMAAGKN